MTTDHADSLVAVQVRRLADEEEIRALLARYCRLCDARDGSAWVREIFTEDGTDDHNLFGQAFHGWTEIEAMFDRSASNLEATAHFITNCTVEVDGDTATARTYVQCWTWLRESAGQGRVRPADYVFVGDYHDQLRRTPAGWRLHYRLMKRLGPGALGLGAPNPTYFAAYEQGAGA